MKGLSCVLASAALALVAEAVWNNPGVAGIAFWQFFDTRTSFRDCRGNGKKIRAMSSAGIFNFFRRPKLCVRTLADWFKNKTPANLMTGKK